MPALGKFREDGLPNTAQYVAITGDISAGVMAVSTNGGATAACITDIVVSKNSDGDFTFYDGSTGNGNQVLKLFVKASDNGNSTDVINFTSALRIKHNAGLHVKCDQSDVDYSLLINYYHSNSR